MDLKDLTWNIKLAWTNFLLKLPHRCTYCKRWVWPSKHPWRVRKKWFHKECYREYDRERQEQLLKKVLAQK